MADFLGLQLQVAAFAKVHFGKRVIQICDAMLDHTDFFRNPCQQLCDALVGRSVQVFQKSIQFFRQRFFAEHFKPLQIIGNVIQLRARFCKCSGIRLPGLFHETHQTAFVIRNSLKLLAMFLLERICDVSLQISELFNTCSGQRRD